METHSNRLLVFAFVGTLLATLLVFAVWLFLGSNPYGRDYLIRFEDSVTGVSKGSPLTFSGVPAGSVTEVRLAENDPSTVLVTVRLDPDIPIARGVEATVSRSFIRGDATVNLDGARNGAPPIVPIAGERLPVIPAKKGGLLGPGGDPKALIEKISSSVDKVSSNLDAKGQERVRARLALLAERSEDWSGRASHISDGLTGAGGKVQRVPALAANIHEFGFQRAAKWVASILAHANAKGELTLSDPVFAAEQFVTLVVVAPMRRSALGLAPAAYDAAARERVRRSIELFIAGCRAQASGNGRSS